MRAALPGSLAWLAADSLDRENSGGCQQLYSKLKSGELPDEDKLVEAVGKALGA
jgi:hypothetical protein